MPAKSSTFDNDLLKLIFNGTAVANIADNAARSPLTNLYVALHTGIPIVGGTQTTSEAAYPGYARQAVARTTGGWAVAGNSVSPVANITFPVASSGSESETFFSIGSASTGTGKVFYAGPLGVNQGPFAGLSSTNVLTIPAISGTSVGTTMVFMTLPGSTLPTGVVAGTVYYVKTVAGDQVTLSATNGGATLALTTDGSGIAYISLLAVASPTTQVILTTATAVIET